MTRTRVLRVGCRRRPGGSGGTWARRSSRSPRLERALRPASSCEFATWRLRKQRGGPERWRRTPIELIKCRMQVQMLAREGAFGPAPTRQPLTPFSTISPVPNPRSIVPPRAVGPIAMLLSTLRTSGLRGLWLGQMGTLLRETGGSSAWFTAYEVSSAHLLARRRRLTHDPHLTKQDLRTYELMLSGALAGMSYNLVLFPADSVKSAMQTWAELNPSLPRLGFLQMSTRIWRTRGLRGMYAGCGLTVARSAPSSAMIFVIYETMETRLAGWSGR